MQDDTQAKDVCAHNLGYALVALSRGGVAGVWGLRIRHTGDLPSETGRKAKVSQDRPTIWGEHDVGRLEIANGDGRVLLVQIGQRVTQLQPIAKHRAYR